MDYIYFSTSMNSDGNKEISRTQVIICQIKVINHFQLC